MVVASPAPTREDVRLAPAAIAMAWRGPGRPHEAVAVPGVRLDDGDVLVEVELATVCGSDVHTVEGRRTAPTPLVLGHEYVGRIVALRGAPRAVDGGRLAEGDRVVCSILVSCRACDRCRRGIPQKCRALAKYGHERIGPRWELTGGFASHVHVRAGTAIVRVAETLAPETLAPAGCGTATAWAAIDRADQIVDVDSSVVLVMGAGLIGLTAAAIATDRGARVIVADPVAERAARGADFGAVAVVDPSDPAQWSAALRRVGADEVDVIVEASGASAAVRSAFELIGVGGVIVLVGSVFPTPPVAIDPEALVRGLVTVRGVHNYDARDLSAAVTYLHERGTSYPFAGLVGARHPLAHLDDALAEAGAGRWVRVAVDPSPA